MKKTWKSGIAALLAAATAVGGVSAIAVADEVQPHKVGIAFSGWNSNPNWLMVGERLHNEYGNYGYEFVEVDVSDVDDIPKAAENFISAGCDIVVMHGLYSEAVKSVLPDMTDAGIAVGIVDANLIEDGATYDMMCDEYNTGYALGKDAAEWANENISGTVVAGVLGYEDLEQFAMRGRGIQDAMNEFLNDGSCDIILTAGEQEDGMAQTENMLSAKPDLNLVGAWNSGSGVGAYEALKAAGWNDNEECGLFSIDGTDDELNAILAGGCYKATMEMDLRNQWMVLFQKLVDYADNGFAYPEDEPEENRLWTYPLNVVYEDRAADYLSK